MPTFADAIAPRTVASFRAFLLAELAASGSTISGWSDGAPQRAFLEGEARSLAAESILRVGLASTASIALCIAAGDSWVDAIMTFFDLDDGQGGKGRIKATKAVWTIPMEITPATVALTINSSNAAGISIQSTTGVIFVCTQTFGVDLQAASSYEGDVQFTARVAGTSGNVSPGQITKMISGPAGLSIDLGGTQVRTVTARDQESSADYIARGLGRWGRLGAGWTTPAWDYLIPLYGNNGTTLAVTGWYVDETNPDGPGTVHVWLRNAAGPASVDEVTAVDDGLNGIDVKPVGGVTVTVEAAVAHPLAITATITTDGSNATAEASAEAALTTLSQMFPTGPSTLEPDLVRAILMGSKIVSATIATGSTFKVIALDLPGFGGVLEVTALSLAAQESIALGEVLMITPTVTVLP